MFSVILKASRNSSPSTYFLPSFLKQKSIPYQIASSSLSLIYSSKQPVRYFSYKKITCTEFSFPSYEKIFEYLKNHPQTKAPHFHDTGIIHLVAINFENTVKTKREIELGVIATLHELEKPSATQKLHFQENSPKTLENEIHKPSLLKRILLTFLSIFHPEQEAEIQAMEQKDTLLKNIKSQAKITSSRSNIPLQAFQAENLVDTMIATRRTPQRTAVDPKGLLSTSYDLNAKIFLSPLEIIVLMEVIQALQDCAKDKGSLKKG